MTDCLSSYAAVFIGTGAGLPQFLGVPGENLNGVMSANAYGEELGWTGYAIDAMQERWSALKSGIVLGVAWAGVHVPILSIAGYSFDWIVWHSLYVIAGRVLFVWVYNNAGKSPVRHVLAARVVRRVLGPVAVGPLAPGAGFLRSAHPGGSRHALRGYRDAVMGAKDTGSVSICPNKQVTGDCIRSRGQNDLTVARTWRRYTG